MAITPFYNKNITLFAETNFRNQRKPFGIKRADREKHMYILGKTGMGKTSMLLRMIVQDIVSGEGVCLIDPTGELAEHALHFVPESRVKEVVYFNPADREYKFVFNLFDDVLEDERYAVASGIVNILNDLWRDVWGPRLEYVLTNSILTLLANKETSLLDLPTLLTDAAFRNPLVSNVSDSALSEFWTREFSEDGERFLRPAIEPIRDKMGQLMSNPIVRDTIGGKRSRFGFNDLLDKKKIIICSFNKHEIGEDAAKLFGSAFLLRLLARAKRAGDAAPERDFYLYIDEFHELAFRGFAEFAGSSGNGIRFIISHQYLLQISESARQAIFGNIGTIVAFRVGSSDAAFLAEEFGPTVLPHHLTTLPPHTIILKLLINGKPSLPFSAVTLPPLPKVGLRDRIVFYSRSMYGEPRQRAGKPRKADEPRKAQEEAPASKKSMLSDFREKIAEVANGVHKHKEERKVERAVKKSEKLLEELSPGEEVEF